MGRRVTLDLDRDVDETLTELADALGFTREAAVEYAVRMIGACMREGLIADVPARAWPKEAQLMTGTGGKVIAFPQMRRAGEKE